MEKQLGKGVSTFMFVAILMAFSLGAYAQKTLSGNVTGPDGAGIPGVTIVVTGTTQGTITDIDGNFTLTVSDDAEKLMFSYIGMRTQEVEIGDQTTFTIKMEADVIGVDEVVVVGYGTRMKEELTGAVSTVSAEKLDATAETDVASRLQGQIAGVSVTTSNRPGAWNSTIRIRGVGTINDPNPLYIIDGVPAGPGNNVAPGDIESISVLKDASSAAIYGTRGANGVIIITTKRGRANQQPSINVSVKTGLSNATNQYDLLNPQEYAQAVWLSFANRGVAPSHVQYGSGSKPVIPDYILPGGAMEGEVDESAYSYPDNVIFRANKLGTNWYDEIYQTGVVQEYDVSVSGGGRNSTYAFSGNYLDEEGILKWTDFKRYTMRMNSDANYNNWLKVGESVQISYIDEHGNFTDNDEGSVVSQAYRSQTIIPVYDIAGEFAGSKAPEMGNSANPVRMLYDAQDNNGRWMRILGNAFAEVTLMEGLTAKTLFGATWSQGNTKTYTLPTYEHSEPNTVNGVDYNTTNTLQWNWSNTLNYTTTFGDGHKLNLLLGTEAIDYNNVWANASRRVYFSEDPNYMQLDSGESNKENSGNASEWSLFSVFGRINYDYMGKYYLEATVRRDGSSRFSKENKYATFPAVSAAWALTEESFMQNSRNWLDMLKLRLGWGMSGNDRIGNYNSYSTYSTDSYRASYAIDGSNTSAVSGFKPATLGSENVTWETTITYNIGVDANMLDNHLALALDVWQRDTEDMLFREPIPQVMGIATAPYVNIGKMRNKGFDVEVNYNNSSSDGRFTYSAALTFSHYKNEILKLSGDPDRYIDAASERQKTYTRYAAGTAFPEFFGYIVDGIFQTEAEAAAHPQYGDTDYNQPGHFKFRDVSGPDGVPDGKITPDDRTFIGSPHPDFTTGLNLDLSYSGFDLNMFFYGSFGNKMVNYVTRWIDYGQFNGGLSKDALYKSWGSPYLSNNADASLPKLDQNDISQEPSTAFIEDASYFRLKSLRLGYTFAQGTLDRAGIKKLRIYAQVSNLFTISGYSGLDPEVNPTSGATLGMDRGAWPTPRRIMFGVNLGL